MYVDALVLYEVWTDVTYYGIVEKHDKPNLQPQCVGALVLYWMNVLRKLIIGLGWW